MVGKASQPGAVVVVDEGEQEGFALGRMWAQRVRYNEDGTLFKNANGQPVIDPESIYMGPSAPTREIAFSGTVRLFERVRVYALFDHKGGNYQFNVKDWRRDRAGLSWETVNPDADPDEVLVRRLASQTFLHIQPADFTKLRDLSVSFDIPMSGLRRYAERATITAAGHNLRIWTKYGGADPELNFNGAGSTFNRNDSWTVPMTKRYTLALSVNF